MKQYFLDRWPLHCVCLTLSFCLSFSHIAPCQAQLFGGGEQEESIEVENSLVPESAFSAFVLLPGELVKNPKLSFIPREVITAAGVKNLGFDPMLIEQATAVIAEPPSGTLDTPPRWAIVLRFSKPQGLAGDMINDWQQVKIAGKEAFVQIPQMESSPAFLVYDEITMIYGDASYLEAMLKEGKGNVAKLIKNRDVKGQVYGFVDIEALRPMLTEITSNLPKLAPPMEDLKALPELLKSISFGTDAKKRLTTQIVMKSVDAAAAEEAKEIIANALKFANAALVTEMSNNMDMDDPVQAATVAYVNRIWNKYESKLIPEVDGSTMTSTIHEEVIAIPFVAGFLGSSIDREIQRVSYDSKTQGRQIALAVLNYESAYRKFPPHTVFGEDGKPLFSGRVAFLPFIDQYRLHQQLRLDEPWDSPHNREITDMSIQAYEDLNGEGMIRFPVFPGSIWDSDEGIKIGQITDGTSNTILAIQAPSDTSWADPAPWKISETNPMRDVFGNREAVLAVFSDGSTRYLKKSEMTNKKLSALLTRAGGEIIER